jgi:hypothetical protein
MTHVFRHVTSRFVSLAAICSLSASLSSAQAPGRGAPPREVRGAVQSVDAKARTITAMAGDGRSAPAEKTYKLAKDAEVAFALSTGNQQRGLYTAGKLEDLAAGSAVTLTLADGSDDTVTSVAANGATLRGRLKSVDAAKKTITATLFSFTGRDAAPEEKTVTLADGAEVGVDDGRGRRFSVREAELADLVEGSGVTLQLSPDGRSAISVIAEGPSVGGTVLESDSEKKQLKLRVAPTVPGEEPSERTIDLADDAVVVLDDGRGRRLSLALGKPADIPAGSQVVVRLSGDHKEGVYVSAAGPQTGGMLKGIDAEKRTVTVAMFVSRENPPEEKTLDVAADARVMIDGQPGKLADVKTADNGPFVNLRLSLDQKTVQAITVNQNR